jgi:hypothetical protein
MGVETARSQLYQKEERNWLQNVVYVAKTVDTRSLEIFLGLFSVAWGIWLLSPNIHPFINNSVYGILKTYASEDIWGIVSTALGTIRLCAVFSVNRTWRLATCLVGFFMWTIVLISLFQVAWTTTATPVYFTICMGNAYIFTRLSKKPL